MTKKLRKGLIAFLLVTVMACTIGLTVLLTRPAAADNDPSIWDGDLISAGWGDPSLKVKPDEYTRGEDEEGNVTVEIGSAAALAYFAHEVYEDTAGELDGAIVTLTTDIDLNNHLWIPIGGNDRRDYLGERRFSGVFNAGEEDEANGITKNHVISNLNSAEYFNNIKYNPEGSSYYIEYTNGKGTAQIPFDVNEEGGYSYGLFSAGYDIAVMNLTLEGVNISAGEYDFASSGGKKLVPEGVGAILGYGSGNVVLENCIVGTKGGEDSITVNTNGTVAVGGLVGLVYAYGEDTEFENYQDVAIRDCINYASVTCSGAESAVGGLIGYAQYFRIYEISNCLNFGDITGGKYVGGITGYWTNVNEYPENEVVDENGPGTNPDPDEDVDIVPGEGEEEDPGESEGETTSYTVIISGCDNYGNVQSSNGGSKADVGGIVGQLAGNTTNSEENYCSINITLDSCNNYGNVSGQDQNEVGGIMGYYRSTAGITAQITNNFNYGNLFSYGCSAAGGYIGKMESIMLELTVKIDKPEIEETPEGEEDEDTAAVLDDEEDEEEETEYTYKLAGNLNLSGGSLGNVYYTGSSASVGTIIGINDMQFPEDEFGSVLNELFLVGGGMTVSSNAEEMGKLAQESIDHDATRYEDAVSDSMFKYADSEMTILMGFSADMFEEDAVIPETLEIPESVRVIGKAAFAGQSAIKNIVFNGHETEIADFAFDGVGVTELNLPASLEKIGASAFAELQITSVTLPASLTEIGVAAFANCENLNHVILPDTAENITAKTDAFRQTRGGEGAFLIVSDVSRYRFTTAGFEDSLGILTYVININYMYDGEQIATEQRLYGQSYKLAFNDGVWALDNGIDVVGPTDSGKEYVWFDSMDSQNVVLLDNLTEMLAEGNTDTITLYAFGVSEGGGKLVFIPNPVNAVYEKGKSYSGTGINDLLYRTSAKITSSMKVFVNGVENGKIEDAGKYSVEVEVSPIEKYTFSITIDRAAMDLAQLANLEWNITKIGYNSASSQLMDYTLYIYTYRSDSNKEYPSPEPLNDTQISNLGLNSAYTTRNVAYSAVRNRGNMVTISIKGDGYEVVTIAGNVEQDVGKYTATATISAGNNYTFTVGNISPLRGMEIKVSEDKLSADIEKVWYIVDFGNWLVVKQPVTEGDEVHDYTITGHVFGNNGSVLNVSAPELLYGSSDAITMHLYYYDTQVGSYILIGDEAGFGVSDFGDYIHYTMPAGNYRLEVDVAAVTSVQSGTTITHNRFEEAFTFTIGKATLPTSSYISAYLNGQSFPTDIESESIYDSAAAASIERYLTQTAIVGRGPVWSNYPNYYGSYEIEFNLANDNNDRYYPLDELNIPSPGTYRVYYRFTVPSGNGTSNYYTSVENLATNDSRYNYYFDVVKYQVLKVPTIDARGLTYTGTRVLPTVPESELYEIVWSNADDYISGGEHTVYFRLYDDVHYRWEGGVNEQASATYTVAQAENVFTVSPNMLGWNYGSFDLVTNSIRAAARFTENGVIYFTITKDGESKPYSGLEKFTVDKESGEVGEAIASILKELSAGKYVLTVTVPETDNYSLLTANIEFAVGQTLNSWLDGDDDLNLPNWIVGKYDPEENPIIINAKFGTVNYKIVDFEEDVTYYDTTVNSEDELVGILNKLKVGKYMVLAWVDGSDDFSELVERMFTIQVFEAPGLPWWAVLLIVVGALGIAALVIFILWKQGVFRIVTDKILIGIRTRVSVEATIASVRAAKMMEEGRKSVEEANRREEEERQRQAAEEAKKNEK